jgi:hypothetical protein
MTVRGALVTCVAFFFSILWAGEVCQFSAVPVSDPELMRGNHHGNDNTEPKHNLVERVFGLCTEESHF